jgi:formylglycine-generating enzyme required for sulfatase activity
VLETTRVLAPLALWMQEASPGAGLVKGEALRRKLEAIFAERHVDDPEAAARQLLSDARDFASLLLERGAGEFGFIHLTFQEYLAAIAVAQRGQSDLQPVVDILADHIDDARWREVSLLTIGHMGIIQQRDEAAGDVLLRLMERKPGKAGAAIVLAGEAVLDTWPGGVTGRCRDTVKEALLATMTDSDNVKPVMRARAGSLLGALGDPRDLDEMVPVPGGVFIMGDERNGDERPSHTVHVDGFRIGKYPVTNQQYAKFVAATDHGPPQHWRAKTPPRDIWNHPVINVSWYDTCAYCDWLSEVRGEKVRLPTEAEWEKAARGTDGREYPWGKDPDPNKANSRHTKIGAVSAVGCFPTGQSPYDCLDMAGNVLEWTSSLHKPYPYRPDDGREDRSVIKIRTLRGGSWYNSDGIVRCAYRYFNDPRVGDVWVGFRVVSPGF